jgi:succinate dehydrogenase / fumarate reductase membrane anchor subunit
MAMTESVSIKVRRSQLGRVRGAGSAKEGVHHWYMERVTAIALVPLTLWFVFSMVRLAGASQEMVVVWAGHPLNSVLLLSLVLMTFHHMQLGLQVVLEDYVHDRMVQRLSILAVKAGCALLALFAVMAILKLALW